MKNLLIGAISANYTIEDVRGWVESSSWETCVRVLFLYNTVGQSSDLINYLQTHNITILHPTFDFWGNDKQIFAVNTGICNMEVSYELIHNIRFFHIWNYLLSVEYEKVLITDVRDVYFTRNPFVQIPTDKLIATSEELVYRNQQWNLNHVMTNLGMMGVYTLIDEYVYNVGVVAGPMELVKSMCMDIYLLSVGKQKVADQTSFNYLIQTKYKDVTHFSNLTDKFAVHLHVIHSGEVSFDLSTCKQYAIIHQYDRIPNFKGLYA